MEKGDAVQRAAEEVERKDEGRGAVMHRASAAVVGSLEKRMQEVGDGSWEMGRSGSTWFERGEGGGVT